MISLLVSDSSSMWEKATKKVKKDINAHIPFSTNEIKKPRFKKKQQILQ